MKILPIDVLSIQSQTTYSQVGSTMAAPLLQSQQLIVAQVPTVVLSNTPHYQTCRGRVMPIDWFQELLLGVEDRKILTKLGSILVGYLGSVSIGESLAKWLATNKPSLTQQIILIDPVLGDSDCGFYVEPELVAVYQQQLLSFATISTPNVFELESLVGHKLSTYQQIEQAARSLLKGSLQTIVVTGIALDLANNKLAVMIVSAEQERRILEHEYIHDCHCKGTGDLFAACLLAGLLRHKPLAVAVELSMQLVGKAMQQTVNQQYEEFDASYIVGLANKLF